jgi:hypothetical protein
MDAETIKREALDAILDLQLDSTVSNVTHSGKNWCVQFEGDYGQFCDSFQNQFERDNSPRVVREKIKKHLLAQITQLRNKGGRRTTKKGFDDEAARPNVTELFQEAVSSTARTIGDAIDRTLGFTGAGIEAVGEVAETLTSRTTELIRPEPSTSPPAERPKARRTAAKESAPKKAVGKAKRSGAATKAAGKTGRAAAKKSGAKKSSRKRAAGK